MHTAKGLGFRGEFLKSVFIIGVLEETWNVQRVRTFLEFNKLVWDVSTQVANQAIKSFHSKDPSNQPIAKYPSSPAFAKQNTQVTLTNPKTSNILSPSPNLVVAVSPTNTPVPLLPASPIQHWTLGSMGSPWTQPAFHRWSKWLFAQEPFGHGRKRDTFLCWGMGCSTITLNADQQGSGFCLGERL